MWKVAKWGFFATAIALAIFLAGAVGYNLGDSDGGSASSPTTSQGQDNFDILREVYRILQEDFVEPDKLDPALLQEGAIDGIIQALKDRHTAYINPESYKTGVDPISGSFQGIGAQVSQDKDGTRIVIVSPFRNSPAERAGIRPGDVILSVNGESTEGWTVAKAVEKIRGPEGTAVILEIQHVDGIREEVRIVREKIEVPTVFSNLGPTPDIEITDAQGLPVRDLAYIQLQQFTEPAVAAMENALAEVRKGGYRAIILDLRRNPGGALSATTKITDMFMNKGVILTEVDKEGKRTVIEARNGGEAVDIPLVILVGPGSASGSEVLAGALRDNGRTILIGETTFGKGSVNHLRELSNGGAFYVSIARWLTPKGQLIEGVGLQPDIEVASTPDEDSTGIGPQLYAAIDYLQDQLARASR
ncbi:MAG TPA: S41 family peptidase [Dehalococcoidia bacterium]|nr:S41 family peptidase [Dehalococcoidia bacterium]